MWSDLLEALVAVLAFVSFPFLVIAAAAGIVALWDRLGHPHTGH